MVDRLTQIDAEILLHHCLEQGSVIPGRHFREALADENVDMLDAQCVLKSGHIYKQAEHHVKTGEWNYRVEGCIPEGSCFGIVFSFKEIDTVFLVTIFSIERLK